jgi:hypothetical protein
MSATRNAPGKAPRAMRADAQRNRNAILAAARETFEEEGYWRHSTALPFALASATQPFIGISRPGTTCSQQ